jgi:hypothetical protein
MIKDSRSLIQRIILAQKCFLKNGIGFILLLGSLSFFVNPNISNGLGFFLVFCSWLFFTMLTVFRDKEI